VSCDGPEKAESRGGTYEKQVDYGDVRPRAGKYVYGGRPGEVGNGANSPNARTKRFFSIAHGFVWKLPVAFLKERKNISRRAGAHFIFDVNNSPNIFVWKCKFWCIREIYFAKKRTETLR